MISETIRSYEDPRMDPWGQEHLGSKRAARDRLGVAVPCGPRVANYQFRRTNCRST